MEVIYGDFPAYSYIESENQIYCFRDPQHILIETEAKLSELIASILPWTF